MGESSVFLTRILDVLLGGGDQIAFAHRGRSMTYRETFDTLRRLHATLKSEGIVPGQLVAITGGNTPETILLQFASQLLGARVVHVDEERTDLLELLEVDHVLTTEGPLVTSRVARAARRDEDAALPRSIETMFSGDGTNLVCYRDVYEEMARTTRPNPAGPQQVLLIAPLSHPIGNRLTCKALLAGDTVVLHERATGTGSFAAANLAGEA
ncbi:long-chain fatty acid--CoA ligase [Amycolatopsis thermalba]|uniref:Long-chain fatty acid--CoA ligase n=1 Tax=Amycolatopsis thermalba TaxID=944492 RepID=A0ABY4NPG7_9PSEU|nr:MULTISPECIES: AMP-binding protein [Amycolatopsis]UQS22563.1 long-chain fatty acid--CoA ligase [Amycolatopsis thermalba]